MPEWKALNVGVESKDMAQYQNPEFVRVNSMFNVFEVLSKLTTELYPRNLSLTHFYMYIQDTREDNNGLPVVVDSYLRIHRCFHRMYATKNCLRSCTEKKRMLAEFYPAKSFKTVKKGTRDRYKLPGNQHFTPFKMDAKKWREYRESLVSNLESRWSVLVEGTQIAAEGSLRSKRFCAVQEQIITGREIWEQRITGREIDYAETCSCHFVASRFETHLQSNQVKRTPQDCINELIIWNLNSLSRMQ